MGSSAAMRLRHEAESCYGVRMRTNIRVQGPVLAELRSLQSTYEQRTGVRPSLAAVLERVVLDGAAVARTRVLAVDTTPRTGE